MSNRIDFPHCTCPEGTYDYIAKYSEVECTPCPPVKCPELQPKCYKGECVECIELTDCSGVSDRCEL